jgi:hypothetical protein
MSSLGASNDMTVGDDTEVTSTGFANPSSTLRNVNSTTLSFVAVGAQANGFVIDANTLKSRNSS